MDMEQTMQKMMSKMAQLQENMDKIMQKMQEMMSQNGSDTKALSGASDFKSKMSAPSPISRGGMDEM